MKCYFKKKKLSRIFKDERLRNREYGKKISNQIRSRMEQFAYADELADLRDMPASGLHKLKGNAYFAVTVSPNYRLIFEGYDSDDKLSVNERKIVSVNLIDVIDYH
ncbi:addiction module toxin RelE [Fructobacillus sp. M2-14]|uniref:Addiction module toxin RelE n=1 Tax=Fructobacillus broussonetiae TaxID=2713173 RepID=A0ABS5QZK1_9LACO|nr:addiction module toxin RelE [Fructobacillus broussonetiae]